MMYARVQNFLQRRCDLLAEDQFEAYAAGYAMPTVLFLNGAPLVVESLDRGTALARQLRQQQRTKGISHQHCMLSALGLPRGGAFRVWARYHDLAAQGDCLGLHDVIHYCRDTGPTLQIEMSEYSSCTISAVWPQDARTARARR